jgi:hypothetical protein
LIARGQIIQSRRDLRVGVGQCCGLSRVIRLPRYRCPNLTVWSNGRRPS